jgi:hypothetical protein
MNMSQYDTQMKFCYFYQYVVCKEITYIIIEQISVFCPCPVPPHTYFRAISCSVKRGGGGGDTRSAALEPNQLLTN